MNQDVEQNLKNTQEELPRSPGWEELTADERNSLLGQLEQFSGDVEQSLSGIQTLLNRDYEITTSLRQLQQSVKQTADNRRLQREQEIAEKEKKEKEKGTFKPKVYSQKIPVPKTLKSKDAIDTVIDQLQEVKQKLEGFHEIDITFELSDSNE